MAQHARSPAIQPAVPAEPQVAIAGLGNGENVLHARKQMKPLPIEPIERIPAQPNAALPILKHRIEARVGEAFAPGIRCQRGRPETKQPRSNHSHPQVAFSIYQEAAYLGQFAAIRR